MMTRSRFALCCFAPWLLAACSSGIPSHAPSAPRPLACAPLGAPSPSPESLTVVVASFGNRSEGVGYYARALRFVDAQLYETLVQVDCDANIAPGLARAWTDTLASRVTLTLRDDARFWNGDRLTSRDVLESWRAAPSAGDSVADATRRTLLAASTVIDERSLSIPSSFLRALADASLAIRRPTTPQSWPDGSGPFRPASAPGQLDAIALVAVNRDQSTPRIVVRTVPHASARDQLDAGADLLLTSDLATLSYASERADVVSIALNWDRTYVLAAPFLATVSSSVTTMTDTIRAALARDAVRVDARASTPPFWWTDSTCTTTATPVPLRRDSTGALRVESIAYRADDPIARQLAERLVALAAIDRADGQPRLADLAPGLTPSRSLRAEALAPPALSAASRQGRRAFVLSVPAHRVLSCGQIDLTPRAETTLSIIPLIDVRDHAIVRRGRASFVVDWEGIPHIAVPTP